MGDEKLVRMVKPIKKEEEIILMRTLLRDGMNPKQAEKYIEVMEKEVRNNHEKHKEELSKKKKISFIEGFKKIKQR